jgi:hypothetical protein
MRKCCGGKVGSAALLAGYKPEEYRRGLWKRSFHICYGKTAAAVKRISSLVGRLLAQRVSKRIVGQVFSFYGKMLRLRSRFNSLVGRL